MGENGVGKTTKHPPARPPGCQAIPQASSAQLAGDLPRPARNSERGIRVPAPQLNCRQHCRHHCPAGSDLARTRWAGAGKGHSCHTTSDGEQRTHLSHAGLEGLENHGHSPTCDRKCLVASRATARRGWMFMECSSSTSTGT